MPKKDNNLSNKEADAKDEEARAKEVEFYSASVNAWFTTHFEKNKQILTLSALAIGLLMFFYDDLRTTSEFVLWIGSGICFISCILLCLHIFGKNARYLKAIIKETNDQNCLSDFIKKVGFSASCLFLFGVILSFSLVVVKSDFSIQKTTNTEVENVR